MPESRKVSGEQALNMIRMGLNMNGIEHVRSLLLDWSTNELVVVLEAAFVRIEELEREKENAPLS